MGVSICNCILDCIKTVTICTDNRISTNAFSIEFGHDFGSADVVEVGVGFVGYGFGEEGFSCAWRSVEENSCGGLDAEALKKFWVSDGEFYEFSYFSDGFV